MVADSGKHSLPVSQESMGAHGREFSLCKFRVDVALPDEYELKLVGNISELGNWKAAAGIVLHNIQDHEHGSKTLHQAEIPLPRDWSFEYKYVMVKKSNSEDTIWNEGDNHRRVVPNDVDEILYHDSWKTGPSGYKNAKDGTAIVSVDPWLQPYVDCLRGRFARYQDRKKQIANAAGSLEAFAEGYKHYGIVYDAEKKGYHYREWAPAAQYMALIGDFNNWDRGANKMERGEFGNFYCFIPDNQDGSRRIKHETRIKVHVVGPDGSSQDRIPAWSRYTVQQLKENSINYCAVHWDPPQPYQWRHERRHFKQDEGLKIYEAHVGMGGEEGKVNTYNEFTESVIPRIARQGYNCIQLMAIMEHAYYASFGYHVTNFFAASSRFGTPDDLKRLVDTAHSMGIFVIMDIVHSHASKNVMDGINNFDGTDGHYFHSGPRGNHDLWDSRIFNYGNFETLRFLLSNCRWWVDEYKFDGYRFDGVTSMLYLHHGNGFGFSGDYDEYFSPRSMVDDDCVAYLQLANDLLHSMDPPAITIAEDVSGMPGLCRPVPEGGVGFDYRLGMAVPDMWIKLLKEKRDDEWDMSAICWILTNRRYSEKTVTYAESHDQALVGDKTLAFWLMDAEMYTGMSTLQPLTGVVDRGVALHKMIRAITIALGGEAWLNFMGNEFGHPEWIDFPREGNGWSYHCARRQWRLADDHLLRYQHLNNWDRELMNLENRTKFLAATDTYISLKHEGDKVVVFEKGSMVWVFNFHPSNSFTDYAIGVNTPGKYKLILHSDRSEFGGHTRFDENVDFFTRPVPHCNRQYSMQLYIPCRTVAVYGRVN